MNKRKLTKISGTGIAVIMFQALSLLMSFYILIIPGYYYLITNRNVLTFLFDLSGACLPRFEYLILSVIYRKTLNEIIVFFCITGSALIFGLVMGRLLQGKNAVPKIIRIIYLVLILSDVILRVLPLEVNRAFRTEYQIAGVIFRGVMFVLVFRDLAKSKEKVE